MALAMRRHSRRSFNGNGSVVMIPLSAAVPTVINFGYGWEAVRVGLGRRPLVMADSQPLGLRCPYRVRQNCTREAQNCGPRDPNPSSLRLGRIGGRSWKFGEPCRLLGRGSVVGRIGASAGGVLDCRVARVGSGGCQCAPVPEGSAVAARCAASVLLGRMAVHRGPRRWPVRASRSVWSLPGDLGAARGSRDPMGCWRPHGFEQWPGPLCPSQPGERRSCTHTAAASQDWGSAWRGVGAG